MAARVIVIVTFPSIHQPDENFQLFEQGHRIAFGTGVIPWDWSIRSPVLPFVLACIFKVAEPLVGGPEGYLFVARLLLISFSVMAVVAVYQMGRRTSNTHALIAGIVAATWFEIIYFAGRPLNEAVAGTGLLIALSIASVRGDELTTRRLVAIGLCLGACLMLRIQLVLGVVSAALFVGRFYFRARWWPMIAGGMIPIVLFGTADWIVWGGLFHSYVEYVRINLIMGKASQFGVEPAWWYIERLVENWSIALPVLLTLIIVRVRASMLWIVVALAIIASHSAIPHKEYRFVFPALACLIVVAAMGSADLIIKVQQGVGAGWASRNLVIATAAMWVQTSASLALEPSFLSEWFKSRNVILASYVVAKKSNLCGLMFYDILWWETGGYAHLHRNIPIYGFNNHSEEAVATGSTDAFDSIVLSRSSIPHFPGYRLQECVGSEHTLSGRLARYAKAQDVCVLVRDGGCKPVPGLQAP